ncbi:interleukin-20 receptor subunit beta [Myripristis murdjan]|uniref:interleukin-20 receptor subunit beta n=1 Tax=Myripristis murdjan TaxID=586833 RepID=UPI001175D4EA|nr:interleukin-20 receptor subunit beta-like [Myripristis murdjan]
MTERGKVSHGALLLILLDFTNYAWFLPSPHHVSIESVNMRHVLKWRPPQAVCNTTLLYSVQFQGEFELRILNGSWLNAPDCQRIAHTRCDLTSDLASDADYNIHVRAQCGPSVSPWSKLPRAFNRRDNQTSLCAAFLTAPQMAVAAVGGGLQVSFSELPLTVVVSVTVWKRDEEQQVKSYLLQVEQTELQVAALQEGAEYCVSAQTLLDTRSSSANTQCVTIAGPASSWKKVTTVIVTVFVMAGLLSVVFWSVVQCNTDACQTYFRKETLPSSLQPDWQIEILKIPEETELCEPVQEIQPSELPEEMNDINTAFMSCTKDGTTKPQLTLEFT